MSVEAMSWVFSLTHDYNGKKLRGTTKLVLLGLANHADKDGGNSYPKQRTLATYACVDASNVRRALEELWDGGLVTWEHKEGGKAKMRNDERPNLYTIHMEGPHDAGPRERQKINPAREAARQAAKAAAAADTHTHAEAHGCEDDRPDNDSRRRTRAVPHGSNRAEAHAQEKPSLLTSIEPSPVESPGDGLDGPVAGVSPSPSGPEGALFDDGSQPAVKPGKGGPHRDEATGLTDRFWEWHKTARGREPRLEGGAGQKSWLAIRGVFEALLDAGWTEAQVRAAAKDAKLISIASMTFTLGQIEDRAVKAQVPVQRGAWMGSVSAGEVEAREAQEAFHRARLAAAAGPPDGPPAASAPPARAGRLRDPLRDRQPATQTAPDPAA